MSNIYPWRQILSSICPQNLTNFPPKTGGQNLDKDWHWRALHEKSSHPVTGHKLDISWTNRNPDIVQLMSYHKWRLIISVYHSICDLDKSWTKARPSPKFVLTLSDLKIGPLSLQYLTELERGYVPIAIAHSRPTHCPLMAHSRATHSPLTAH